VKHKKKLRTQINRKFNNISSADENNKISQLTLYLKTIKRQYIYSSTEDLEVVLVFEINNVIMQV
jgi:hypothetical protein